MGDDLYTGWTFGHFFTLICCKNCIVCLKTSKINEKVAGVGPFVKGTNPFLPIADVICKQILE